MSHLRIRFALFLLLCCAPFTLLRSEGLECYTHLLDTTLTSTHLGYERAITVTVPVEYQEDVDFGFPVIVIFDRYLERMQGYFLHTVDYLTATLAMPPCIIVSVESGEGERRYFETHLPASHPQAKGPENEAFIFDELFPLIQKRFHAGDFRMLVGHSRYGYFTSFLLQKRPEALNAVISLSPFFQQKGVNLVDSLHALSVSALGHTLYYRFAIGNDYPEDYGLMAEMLDKSPPEGSYLNVAHRLFPEAYHNATPGLYPATALYEIFRYWSNCQNAFFPYGQDNLHLLPALQDSLNSHYGCFMPWSMPALNGKGWEYFNDGKYEKAEKVWSVALKQYPNLAEFHLYIAEARMESGADPALPLAEFRKCMKWTRAYSEDEKAELMGEYARLKGE